MQKEKEKKYNYKFRYMASIEPEMLTIDELILLGEPQFLQIMLPGGTWVWLNEYLNENKQVK